MCSGSSTEDRRPSGGNISRTISRAGRTEEEPAEEDEDDFDREDCGAERVPRFPLAGNSGRAVAAAAPIITIRCWGVEPQASIPGRIQKLVSRCVRLPNTHGAADVEPRNGPFDTTTLSEAGSATRGAEARASVRPEAAAATRNEASGLLAGNLLCCATS